MTVTKIKNMEEFATVSGLSRPTVSKFFNDPQSVRPSTRSRIEEALERFDYRPNIYAINQNRQLTKTIGIVVPYLADPFFAEIARNLETRCIEEGYSPSLFSSHGRQEQENDILETLRSMKPAGVLMAPLGRISDKSLVERFCNDVPTVLFDSKVEGVGHVFIGSDNMQFTSMMVEYLNRTGDAPCFFEMKTPANPNARKRRQAYIQAMERLGHQPKFVQVDGTGWEFEEIGHRGGMEAISHDAFETSTVLCSNDRLAIGLLAACYQKGVRVGLKKDCHLRVAGHDDHPFSKFTCPSLTTVAQDYSAIAEKSVRRLFELIAGESDATPSADTLFEGKLVMRDSA
ncbi:LacI family DNA-binding transcriptional regulator [Ahrensia sp. 13_GOM-1096m]|uniref:LacI family DNA-binding transcriptional regulator n=1 Tax=Ahrensia sp. 13_GOM-1096m TaxID=1380380 RepID=UPI00047E1BA1|nr:LacI family DNA-binding transcriptional regulator [Ahrensia sp. 13_GOM-1096m]